MRTQAISPRLPSFNILLRSFSLFPFLLLSLFSFLIFTYMHSSNSSLPPLLSVLPFPPPSPKTVSYRQTFATYNDDDNDYDDDDDDDDDEDDADDEEEEENKPITCTE